MVTVDKIIFEIKTGIKSLMYVYLIYNLHVTNPCTRTLPTKHGYNFYKNSPFKKFHTKPSPLHKCTFTRAGASSVGHCWPFDGTH